MIGTGLSIRARLMVLCAGFGLLTGVVAALGAWAFWTVNAALQRVTSQALPAVTQLLLADGAIQHAVIAERSLMFMKADTPEAKTLVKLHGERVSALDAHWTCYTELSSDTEDRRRWATFETARRE